MGESRSSPRW